MIHYALRCGDGHEFDGWFPSSASFDRQAGAGLLDCPVCASTSVQRALMSPRIAGGAAPPPEPAASQPAATPASPAGQADAVQDTGTSLPSARPVPPPGGMSPQRAPLPDGMRAALQRIRAEVEKHCEYVGPGFASEVRRMAEKTVPPRPIYGEATPSEAEALAEDGIDVTHIPWVPRADS